VALEGMQAASLHPLSGTCCCDCYSSAVESQPELKDVKTCFWLRKSLFSPTNVPAQLDTRCNSDPASAIVTCWTTHGHKQLLPQLPEPCDHWEMNSWFLDEVAKQVLKRAFSSYPAISATGRRR